MLQKYKCLEQIGEGYSSKVFRVAHGTEYYAMKIVNRSKMNDIQLRLLANEVELLTKLKCVNIITLIEQFSTQFETFIVTELCEFGSLEDQLKIGHLNDQLVLQILQQMSNALYLLRQNRVLHNDIKPSNIFVTKQGYKLADFGFAYYTNQVFPCNVGSPSYMAPETLSNNIHTHATDMWSLGITAFQMSQGHCPFEALSEKELIVMQLKQKASFRYPVSQKLQDIILKLLEVNPAKRHTVESLIACFVQEPQEQVTMPARKSIREDLTTRKRSFTGHHEPIDIRVCQVARKIRDQVDCQLLQYALNGVIIYFSNFRRQEQEIHILLDKERQPDIFSMSHKDILLYCSNQLRNSLIFYSNKLVVNQQNLQDQQANINLLFNLYNVWQFLIGKIKLIAYCQREFNLFEVEALQSAIAK